MASTSVLETGPVAALLELLERKIALEGLRLLARAARAMEGRP